MSGFLDIWFSRARPDAVTSGTSFILAMIASGANGGQRNPAQRRVGALVAGGAAAVGAAALGLWLWRRR